MYAIYSLYFATEPPSKLSFVVEVS